MQFDLLYLDEILISIRDHATVLCLSAVVFFIYFQDKRALRYSLLCSFFYILGNISYPIIMKFDYSIYLYRYVYWAFSDIAFMAILAYWTLNDRVYLWQGVIGQIIVLPAPLLQLFRLVDRHLLDLSYSTYLYKTILPLVNSLIVLICLIPAINVIRSRLNPI